MVIPAALRTGRPLAVLGLALLCATGPSRPAAGSDPPIAGSRSFTIARLKYGGGGDWYEDRTSLVNLLRGVRDAHLDPGRGRPGGGGRARRRQPVPVPVRVRLRPRQHQVHARPRSPTCGATSTPAGFLWVDDDFGIEPSFRREMKRVFPDAAIVELPFSHPIFHGLYDFPARIAEDS